jgi:predicted SprT family Zn-dependent metalloprotease
MLNKSFKSVAEMERYISARIKNLSMIYFLPAPEIYFGNYKKMLGQVDKNTFKFNKRMFLALESVEHLEWVIKHEFAHYLTDFHEYEQKPHGPRWQKNCERLRIKPTVIFPYLLKIKMSDLEAYNL